MANQRLAEFLLARIADDEDEISDAMKLGYPSTLSGGYAQMLAECEAKRRIVELALVPLHEGGYGEGLELAVAYLALPHADHPDYREEWKP